MPAELRQIIEGVLLVFAALLPDRQSVRRRAGVPGDDRRLHAGIAASARAPGRASTRSCCCSAPCSSATYVLDFFGLSVPVVQVAGGMIVCALGWDLLRQDATVPIP